MNAQVSVGDRIARLRHADVPAVRLCDRAGVSSEVQRLSCRVPGSIGLSPDVHRSLERPGGLAVPGNRLCEAAGLLCPAGLRTTRRVSGAASLERRTLPMPNRGARLGRGGPIHQLWLDPRLDPGHEILESPDLVLVREIGVAGRVDRSLHQELAAACVCLVSQGAA